MPYGKYSRSFALAFSIALSLALSVAATAAAANVSHPRLWVTTEQLPQLRSWAQSSNPIYQEGLLRSALEAKTRMDQNRLEDAGGIDYESDPLEQYAALFAFMSLVGPEKDRANYAERAKKLLFKVITAAEKGVAEGQSYRDPEFTVYNRSRWHGAAWGLAVDWLYNTLSSNEKQRIAKVFARWTTENMNLSLGYPCSDPGTECFVEGTEQLLNDPQLLQSERGVRWSQNNYYTAHARNAALMALSLNPSDDPSGVLQQNLDLAIGRHLYVINHGMGTIAKGGLGAEGFEYSPQTMGYVAQLLLALRTAGRDVEPQSRFDHPFWQAYPAALMASLMPKSSQNSDYGAVYQALWYGDGQENYAPDFIESLAPLGIQARLSGDARTAAAMRWIERTTPPGGASELISRAQGTDNRFTNAILYFLLFEPKANIQDPRSQYPTHQYVSGIGKILARDNWSEQASGISFTAGWNTIDHQAADALSLEFFAQGDWILKKRVGYGFGWVASDNQNAPLIQNDPTDRDDYRKLLASRGSSWLYRPSNDARMQSYSFGTGYTYAHADATQSYNSDYEDMRGVTQALRSVLWLEPHTVIVLDQLATAQAGRFKRLAFNFPVPKLQQAGQKVSGQTSSGVRFYLQSVLPSNAALTVKAAPSREGEFVGDPDPSPAAHGEPSYQRVSIEATGAPAQTTFLTVLGTTQPSQAIGQSGVLVGDTAVYFAQLQASGSSRYNLPAGVRKIYLVGLKAHTSYRIQRTANSLELTEGTGSGSSRTDAAGVLSL